MKLVLGRHALEQARERGITVRQIKEAIQKGAKYLQGKKIISDYTYIRIVYKKIKDECFVITVMIRKG